MQFSSPAKLNLFLKMIARRPDGYHDLASLFQTISLFDTLNFDLTADDRLTCSDPLIPTDGRNLVIKALELFRRKTAWQRGVTIHLEKNIPYEAGLGGGSGNAATTLWALNRLSGKNISDRKLMEWGAELGSDVAFFLSQGTAYCTGRGEIIKPLESLAPQQLYIAKPAEGLSTPAVYRQLDVKSLPQRDPEQCLAAFYHGQPYYFNDLEIPAFQLMPQLSLLRQRLLDDGFQQVVLCGSGSALFCLGQGSVSSIPTVRGYHAQYVRRQPGEWYQPVG